ncbi:hypothetical protein JHK85_013968 [Glycine max]|nr:hypothetical protein JHK85_013968 [Glycine max]
MESLVNVGFTHLQSCGDSSEEESSVLPRHTKVVVTGNNNTKSVLVGLEGVVKKVDGLDAVRGVDKSDPCRPLKTSGISGPTFVFRPTTR